MGLIADAWIPILVGIMVGVVAAVVWIERGEPD